MSLNMKIHICYIILVIAINKIDIYFICTIHSLDRSTIFVSVLRYAEIDNVFTEVPLQLQCKM